MTGRKPQCSCGECKNCGHAAYMREWYRKNKRSYKNADKAAANRRLHTYGITEDEFNQMYASQRGLCRICQQPETVLGSGGKVKMLSVDHDHTTGQVRGLLCNNCNRAIGLLKDSPALLQAAIDYLSYSSEVNHG